MVGYLPRWRVKIDVDAQPDFQALLPAKVSYVS